MAKAPNNDIEEVQRALLHTLEKNKNKNKNNNKTKRNHHDNIPCLDRCSDILKCLEEKNTKDLTKTFLIVKSMKKCVRLLKEYKKCVNEKKHLGKWDGVIFRSERLLSTWKSTTGASTTGASTTTGEEKPLRQKKNSTKKSPSSRTSSLRKRSTQNGTNNNNKEEEEEEEGEDSVVVPTSICSYRNRLLGQKKELFKDPPMLPPCHIVLEEEWIKEEPTRNKQTGELTFLPGQEDADLSHWLHDFRPNQTPQDVLRAGSFGGTYFRSITSAVTNVQYISSNVLQETIDPTWIRGLDVSTMLTSAKYNPSINKYGVKCGGSLAMWESSGWIADSDPYGWFQWYCRFYRGRRSSDDVRQIRRWLNITGPKGRFRNQLCNKCILAKATADDASISPVIRQTLLHWGFELTTPLLEQYRRSK